MKPTNEAVLREALTEIKFCCAVPARQAMRAIAERALAATATVAKDGVEVHQHRYITYPDGSQGCEFCSAKPEASAEQPAGEVAGFKVIIDPAMPPGTMKMVGANTVMAVNIASPISEDTGKARSYMDTAPYLRMFGVSSNHDSGSNGKRLRSLAAMAGHTYNMTDEQIDSCRFSILGDIRSTLAASSPTGESLSVLVDLKAIHSAVLTLRCDPKAKCEVQHGFYHGVHSAAAVVSRFAPTVPGEPT